ncbi:MAG: DUF2953 domain-containing protein [Chitinivibrionales bacterium]|nr:DUF2953 domain-containing protein [Chitinivibrionales bacterium]
MAVVIIIAGLLLLLLSIILFNPASITFAGKYQNNIPPAASLVVSWMPFKVYYNLQTKAFDVFVAGIKLKKLVKGDSDSGDSEKKTPLNPEKIPDPDTKNPSDSGLMDQPFVKSADVKATAAPSKKEAPAPEPAFLKSETSDGGKKIGLLARIQNKLGELKKNRLIFFGVNKKWRGKILRWLWRVLKSFRACIRITHVSGRLRANNEDPALTGMLYGYWHSLSRALAYRKKSRVKISFEPVFNEDIFMAEGSLRLSTSIGRLLWPFAFAVVTFPLICTLTTFLAARKNSRT